MASWPARAGAFAIDVLAPAGLIVTATLVTQGTPLGKWLWWAVYAGGLVLLVAVSCESRAVAGVDGLESGTFGVRDPGGVVDR